MYTLLSGTAAGESIFVDVPDGKTITVQASGLTSGQTVEIHQRSGTGSVLSYYDGNAMTLTPETTQRQITGPWEFRVKKGVTASCEVGYFGCCD
jgi:hypothetical protein